MKKQVISGKSQVNTHTHQFGATNLCSAGKYMSHQAITTTYDSQNDHKILLKFTELLKWVNNHFIVTAISEQTRVDLI